MDYAISPYALTLKDMTELDDPPFYKDGGRRGKLERERNKVYSYVKFKKLCLFKPN